MTSHTITKKSGETITFQTDLTLEQAAGALMADVDRNARPMRGFAWDLLQAWEAHVLRGARFSATQGLWLLKLAADLQDKPADAAKPSGFSPLVEAVRRFQDGKKSRVIFRLQGLTIKACTYGANEGGAYLFRGSTYLGKLTAAGELRLSGVLGEQGTISLEQQLLDAAADPLAAAVAYGQATGSCACCGRELTDPVSVFAGIGPICLERMFGPEARRNAETGYAASTLEATVLAVAGS